jgi:hypothetical protein
VTAAEGHLNLTTSKGDLLVAVKLVVAESRALLGQQPFEGIVTLLET